MSTTDTGLVRHVYDGERCRFCGANVHDADTLGIECVPRERMTWTSETPAPDTERDEQLRGIQARVEHLTPRPGEWSSNGLYVSDAGWLLAEVARLDAVVTAQAATIARLHDVGTGIVSHRYAGDCPVGPPFSPTKRDPACPACRALDGGAR